MLCNSFAENAKRLLFWVTTCIQDKHIWALADTGSCRNLMSENFYKLLPVPSKIFPPGHTIVVAGDGKVLDLLGWALFNFEIGGKNLYHEVGIVRDLPVDFLLGRELRKPHGCSLQYSNLGRNVFELGNLKCFICESNYEILKKRAPHLLNTNFVRQPLRKFNTLINVTSEMQTLPAREDPETVKHREKLEKVLLELKGSEMAISQKRISRHET